MKLRDPDEQPSRARDLLVAALGFLLILVIELVVCAVAPAERRRAVPTAKCVLDGRAEGMQF